MTTKKLELRIDLADTYVPISSTPVTPNNTLKSGRKSGGKSGSRFKGSRVNTPYTDITNRTTPKSTYHSSLGPVGSAISGASVVNTREIFQPKEDNTKKSANQIRESSRQSKARANNISSLYTPFSETPSYTHFITPTRTGRVSKTPGRTSRITPVSNIQTPLHGNAAETPLEPYRPIIPRHPSTAPNMGRRNATAQKKVRIDEKPQTQQSESRVSDNLRTSPSSMQALKELFEIIGKETQELTFKEMLEIKVAISMQSHMSRESLEDFTNFQSILEELCMYWKINRLDLDFLEFLLQRIGLFEMFKSHLDKYKESVDYDVLTASSERDVTTIISTLHNLLQGSVDASGTYTTICFLHYGGVYNFDRTRLKCMKSDLSRLLGISTTQIIYLAKVATGNDSYATVMQMPVTITKRFLGHARKNNPTLMSLGIKGVQITGSDGLRYTQSMGYLQDKVPVHTQTSEAEFRVLNRSARTAPAGPNLPPLERKHKHRGTVAQTGVTGHHTSMARYNLTKVEPIHEDDEPKHKPAPINIQQLVDQALATQMDPHEAKFERRVRLARDTLTQLSPSERDGLVNVLLDQIQKLHRTISNLKKDLRDKTRDLNASQNYVQRAQKEIKSMEMRVETKAQEISKTNEHLIKRVKKLMNENLILRETVENRDAEVEIYKQADRENTFGGLIRVKRVSRGRQHNAQNNTLSSYA